MSLPPDYWPSLATDYVAAYKQAFSVEGQEPLRSALLLAMSVAEHETNNGRAWPGTNNFGAVQLRTLTLQERAAFDAGTLRAGDYTPSRDGVLHVDTHPGPSGPVPYPIWFAAFDKRADGIAHFLKVLWRLSDAAPDKPDATPTSVACAMYRRGYYEGAHHGARAVYDGHGQIQRTDPMTAPEQANVSDYAHAVEGCLAMICGALGSWDYGRDVVLDPADPTQPMPLPFNPESQPPGAA